MLATWTVGNPATGIKHMMATDGRSWQAIWARTVRNSSGTDSAIPRVPEF